MEGPEGRTPEARGLQGSGPSPEATQGRLPTVSSQVSHCSRVPEQSLAVRARKPVMHQRIEPNQEWGYLPAPPGPRLGDAFVPPHPPQAGPGRAQVDRVSTASTFPRACVWGALLPRAPALPPLAALAAPPCPSQVAEGLPLGLEQTELQPAWQHLRLSRHWSSEEHSFAQSVLSWSWGHTPAFSAPAPRDGGSGELWGRTGAQSHQDTQLLLQDPQISTPRSSGGVLVPGTLLTPPQRAPSPGQGSLTLGDSLMLGFRAPVLRGPEPLAASFGHPGSFPLHRVSAFSTERASAPPTFSLQLSPRLQNTEPQILSFKNPQL